MRQLGWRAGGFGMPSDPVCASRQAGGPAEGRLVVIRLGAGVPAGPVDRTAPDHYGRLERHDMVAPPRHEGARPHQEEL
ncbi:hypothetical protein GPN2_22105 [Streptomyces murinus]